MLESEYNLIIFFLIWYVHGNDVPAPMANTERIDIHPSWYLYSLRTESLLILSQYILTQRQSEECNLH